LINAEGFSPPLALTQAEARDMFRRFGRALDEVAARSRRSGKRP
jgi:hypothetical protein